MSTEIIQPPAQAIPGRDSRRWLLLAIVLIANLIVVIDGFIVNVALPSIERHLQTSFGDAQLVVAGYTLSFAVLLVTGGRLGDIYGRKRLFLVGVAGFTLFSALCGFTPTAFLLVVFRIGQGAMAALLAPQMISFIQLNFDPQERPVAMSAYAATAGLASIVGQVFGGFLLDANIFGLGWRTIFLVNLPIGALVLVLGGLLIRESRVEDARHLDYGGMALLSVTLFLLVFPLVLGGESGWPLWSQLSLALTIPGFVAFLAYEQRLTGQGKTPLVALKIFRLRSFNAGISTSLLSGALFAALMFLLPFYLQTILQLGPLQSGLVFLPASISFIVASSSSSVFMRLLGKYCLPVASALVTLAYLLLWLAVQFLVAGWGVAAILAPLFLVGFGMGLLVTPLMYKALEKVAPDNVGTASGIYTTVSQISGALGVAVFGLIFTSFTANSLDAFIICLVVITLLSAGLLLSVQPFNKN